jgi:flagellar hook assembly protein FlgD
VLTNPPGFRRKFAKGDVKVPEIEFTDSKELYMATVLPYQITKGEQAIIVCKSTAPGELTVDLYSKQGKKLETLFTGGIDKNRTVVLTWDGKSSANKKTYKGEYTIRWTIGGGYREFPLVLK